jgi:hypothetical protein
MSLVLNAKLTCGAGELIALAFLRATAEMRVGVRYVL